MCRWYRQNALIISEKWWEGLFSFCIRLSSTEKHLFENTKATRGQPDNGLNRRSYSVAKERQIKVETRSNGRKPQKVEELSEANRTTPAGNYRKQPDHRRDRIELSSNYRQLRQAARQDTRCLQSPRWGQLRAQTCDIVCVRLRLSDMAWLYDTKCSKHDGFRFSSCGS